jgi:hypothetical protein
MRAKAQTPGPKAAEASSTSTTRTSAPKKKELTKEGSPKAGITLRPAPALKPVITESEKECPAVELLVYSPSKSKEENLPEPSFSTFLESSP